MVSSGRKSSITAERSRPMTTSRVPIRRSGLGSTGVVALSLVFSLFSHPALAQNKEKLPDGVEHYYFPATANGDSYLSKLFSQIYDVVFTTKSVRPLRKKYCFPRGCASIPQSLSAIAFGTQRPRADARLSLKRRSFRRGLRR